MLKVKESEEQIIHLKSLEGELLNLIDDKKFDQLKTFVELNSLLSYFWKLQISKRGILKKALDDKQTACYAFLYKSGFLLENTIDPIHPFAALSWKEKCTLSDEIHKYFISSRANIESMEIASPLVKKLISKSNTVPYDNFTKSSFEDLCQRFAVVEAMPENKKILEMVADCPRLQIYFDAYQCFVAFMQPRLSMTLGTCDYENGRIFLCCGWGEEKDHMVIIHEFLHYCIFMLYDNEAFPYRVSNLEMEKVFLDVYKTSENVYRANPSAYGALKDVFECKGKDGDSLESILAEKLTELPVMPGTLIVRFRKDPETLQVYKENFQVLFNFYNTVTLKDIQNYEK